MGSSSFNTSRESSKWRLFSKATFFKFKMVATATALVENEGLHGDRHHWEDHWYEL